MLKKDNIPQDLFGSILAEKRIEQSKSQEQMANVLGITKSAYAHYEENKSKPRYGTLLAIADYFDMPLDTLVGRNRDDNSAQVLSREVIPGKSDKDLIRAFGKMHAPQRKTVFELIESIAGIFVGEKKK